MVNLLNKKTGSFLFLVFVLCFSFGISSGQPIEPDPLLQSYIREALENNPDLSAWSERVNSAEQRISQAGAWNDPVFTFGMRNLPVNTFDMNQEAMTGTWLTLSQSVPLTHRYSRQKDIASLVYQKTIVTHQAKELEIVSMLSETWYDWSFLNMTKTTLDSAVQVFDGFLETSKRKYETGQGLQQDLLRIETERSRLIDKRVMFSQMAKSTGEKFAILLGRDPSDVPAPSNQNKTNYKILDSQELDSLMLADNPVLKAQKTNHRIAEHKVGLKKSLRLPNMNINAGYGFRQKADNGMDRPDFFSITAGFSIPIFASAKQNAAVEEAQADSRQAQSELDSRVLQLRFQLQSLINEDTRLNEQIRIYNEEVIPQASSTLAATTSTYSVGKTDIDALLMAELALFSSQIERLDRIRNRQNVRIKIASIIGDKRLVEN